MSTNLPVIATWVGVLSDSGLLRGEREAEGVILATQVVGEQRLSELRYWLAQQTPASIVAQRTAAIELCIWMAVVDRVIDPSERELLSEVICSANLDGREEQRLLGLLASALSDVRKLTHVETLAELLDHPTLRELMLAMTWHVALIDGYIDDLEVASYHRLAAIFGVDANSAQRIKTVLDSPFY